MHRHFATAFNDDTARMRRIAIVRHNHLVIVMHLEANIMRITLNFIDKQALFSIGMSLNGLFATCRNMQRFAFLVRLRTINSLQKPKHLINNNTSNSSRYIEQYVPLDRISSESYHQAVSNHCRTKHAPDH